MSDKFRKNKREKELKIDDQLLIIFFQGCKKPIKLNLFYVLAGTFIVFGLKLPPLIPAVFIFK